jgi:hypothetical protein
MCPQSLERQLGAVHSSSQTAEEERRSESRRVHELEIGV